MSFNVLMHPRNVFKNNSPNFKELAKKYVQLRKHCFISIGGKVQINFQDPDAVRTLSEVLLFEFFDLHVNLSSSALIPRIPQRLNYILLIEDLLNSNDLNIHVTGIDIGTGSSCIFPLIGARKNGWNFIATDIDHSSLDLAKENILINSFSEKIKIVTSTPGVIFKSIFSDNSCSFDFCMCNPPFFDPEENDKKFSDKSQSGILYENIRSNTTKDPPRSATLAKSNEIFTKGGEVSFILQILDESLLYRERIRIYTSMIGKKGSLIHLTKMLKDNNINHSIYTLSQGRTQRWVIAWTFLSNLNFPSFDK